MIGTETPFISAKSPVSSITVLVEFKDFWKYKEVFIVNDDLNLFK